MPDLDDVSAETLRDELAAATGAKPALRLVVALDYKDGVAVSTLSERYGVPESTLYHWLDRFASLPVADAASDAERPGRPPALSADARDRLAAALRDSPAEHGLETGEWTTAALQSFVRREFDVDYSDGHLRRLRRELGPTGE